MTTDAHAFPPPAAYDTPILGPRSERAKPISPRRRRLAFWSSVGASSVAGALALALHRRGAMTVALAFGGALALVRWQWARLFTEEADYVVERKAGPLEIRRYARYVVAETDVDADDVHAAANEGFRRLFQYLRGNRITMTTPVEVSRSDRRDASSMRPRPNAQFVRVGPGRFSIRFVMPEGTSLDALPQASDARIHIREIPEHRIAALRFKGRMTERNVEAAHRALDEAMTHALLTGRGEHVVAGYDPPTTLPIFRRNEVWSKLA